ncbi:MAG TPA: hypothetical protein VMT46_04240 [Anaerolineaceae bacterium]|nr:hypothetical protein [Anaerolineaceae bacterium]
MYGDSQAVTIRVILVADYPEKLAEMKSVLGNNSGIKIIGEACSCSEAEQLVQNTHPDLMILDLSRPDERESEWQELQNSLSGIVRMVTFTS